MIQSRATIMGMPVLVKIDSVSTQADIEAVFDELRAVDARFSTYKPDSEISQINAGKILEPDYSPLMREVFEKCEAAKLSSGGYFNIWNGQILDPSGLVKGWAIERAGQLLLDRGITNFCLDVGGDVLVMGLRDGQPWIVGIRHPVERSQNIKRLALSNLAIATSGNYERGDHIYDPITNRVPTQLHSFTVVGPSIMLADVLATIGYAMGPELGLQYVDSQPGYSAYAVTRGMTALSTRSFAQYNKA